MTSDNHWSDWRKAFNSGIVGASPDAIRLSRYQWLTPSQSQEAAFPEYLIIDLLPFAKGMDGSWVGWIQGENGVDCPIIMSPRDEEFAIVVGKCFGDGLFWMLVDELQNCWLNPADEGNTVWRINEWLPRLKPLLSPSQFDLLFQIANVGPQEVTEDGASFILPPDFKSLWLVYPLLNPKSQRIRQYEPLDR